MGNRPTNYLTSRCAREFILPRTPVDFTKPLLELQMGKHAGSLLGYSSSNTTDCMKIVGVNTVTGTYIYIFPFPIRRCHDKVVRLQWVQSKMSTCTDIMHVKVCARRVSLSERGLIWLLVNEQRAKSRSSFEWGLVNSVRILKCLWMCGLTHSHFPLYYAAYLTMKTIFSGSSVCVSLSSCSSSPVSLSLSEATWRTFYIFFQSKFDSFSSSYNIRLFVSYCE